MKSGFRIPFTYFAPAEREPIEIVHRQAATLQGECLPPQLREGKFNYVFVFNQQRQIVFASSNVRDLVPAEMPRQLLGLRLGEALGCIHSQEQEGGCGTSEACRECGAVQAVLHSLARHGRHGDSRQFRLTRFVGCHQEALEFVVAAVPLVRGEQIFSVLALAKGTSAANREELIRLLGSLRG